MTNPETRPPSCPSCGQQIGHASDCPSLSAEPAAEIPKPDGLPEHVEVENDMEFIQIPQVPLEEIIPGTKEAQQPKIEHGNRFDCGFVGFGLRSILKSHLTPQAFQEKMQAATEKGDDAEVDALKKKYPEHYAIARFKDQTVVDLGCGFSPTGYFLALLGGARGYVGVDKFYESLAQSHLFSKKAMSDIWLDIAELYGYGSAEEAERLLKGGGEGSAEMNNRLVEQVAQKMPIIPAVVDQADMLEFVKRLPDESVSFLMAGIDETIITNYGYSGSLSEEMGRTMHADGVVVTMDGGISPSWDTADGTIKTERLRRLRQNHINIYEKISRSELRPRNISHEFETMDYSDFEVLVKDLNYDGVPLIIEVDWPGVSKAYQLGLYMDWWFSNRKEEGRWRWATEENKPDITIRCTKEERDRVSEIFDGGDDIPGGVKWKERK